MKTAPEIRKHMNALAAQAPVGFKSVEKIMEGLKHTATGKAKIFPGFKTKNIGLVYGVFVWLKLFVNMRSEKKPVGATTSAVCLAMKRKLRMTFDPIGKSKTLCTGAWTLFFMKTKAGTGHVMPRKTLAHCGQSASI